MKDYKKLVKALRIRSGNLCPGDICDRCEAIHFLCSDKVMHDAAAAIEALQEQVRMLDKHDTDLHNEGYDVGYYAGRRDWEPKRGEWIEENRRPRSSQFVCSVCHRTAYDPQPTRDKAWRKRCRYAYCPNCGADMRAKREMQE